VIEEQDGSIKGHTLNIIPPIDEKRRPRRWCKREVDVESNEDIDPGPDGIEAR